MAKEGTAQPPPAVAPQAAATILPSATSRVGEAHASAGGAFDPPPAPRSRLLMAAVLANSVLAVFTVGLIISLAWPRQRSPLLPRSSQAAPASMPAEPTEADLEPEAAPSWAQAEKLFLRASHASALQEYRRLVDARNAGGAQGAEGSLLTLRQAQCLFRLDKDAESQELLHSLRTAESAAVQAATHHLLALLEARARAWMRARTHAYAAIAALGWLDLPSPLETDCDFVAAEMLAREATAMHNRNVALPEVGTRAVDLFVGLEPSALARLLEQGPAAQGGTLGVEVRRADEAGGPRYFVQCRQAPLEEVLARLAAEGGLDVTWESVDAKVRRRGVTLRMTAATPQRLLEVACGSAALVARFTGKEVLVHDPASAASLLQRREVLTAEATSAWRRIFLHAPQDHRLPEAHLILGAVYECSGDHASALAEYRLVANRFGQAPAAGSALLRSALVRMELNDYAGAGKDLQEVLDNQADPALIEQAHLQLGLAAMKAGQYEEAARSFRKLYYLDLSLPAKAQAALHLGRCLYARGQPSEAAPWVAAYLEHSRQESGPDVREAAFLLARCRIASSQPAEAAAAFRLALAADKDPLGTAEITLELCRFLMTQGDYVGALGALNTLGASGLSQAKAGEVLLLHAQLLRTVGLPRKAIQMLQKAEAPAQGSPLSTRMEVELARCRVADGDLEGARAALTQALPKTPQGPEAQELVCELAEICLRLGEARQTASLITDLLRLPCGDALRRRACQALAAACVLQHDYEGAALAYAALEARQPEAPKP